MENSTSTVTPVQQRRGLLGWTGMLVYVAVLVGMAWGIGWFVLTVIRNGIEEVVTSTCREREGFLFAWAVTATLWALIFYRAAKDR